MKTSDFIWGVLWAIGVLFILVCVWDYVWNGGTL